MLRSDLVWIVGWSAALFLLLAMLATALLLTLRADIRAVLEDAQAERTAQQSFELAQAAVLAAQQSGGAPQISQLLGHRRAALDLAKRVGQGEFILGYFVQLQQRSSRWMGPLLGVILVLGSIWLGASPGAIGPLEITAAALILLSAFAIGSFYGLMLLEVPRLRPPVDAVELRGRMARHLIALLGLRAGALGLEDTTRHPPLHPGLPGECFAAYWLLRLGSTWTSSYPTRYHQSRSGRRST